MRTHASTATHWNYSTGWYGDYVDQAVVDTMTEQGMLLLTGAATLADAWRAILPSYVAGQKIAIKANLNSAYCRDTDNRIDALPQPINAVIRGLKSIGVAEGDIWIYDVTVGSHRGMMPNRLINKVRALYPGVQFHTYTNDCSSPYVTTAGYSNTEFIHFNPPAGKPAINDRPICNALVNATYLINMPIMKRHIFAGVTLSFKNHYGSFQDAGSLHWPVQLDDPNYTSSYSSLIDIYNNPHFKNKTVLTIGDGLFGARVYNSEVPSRWTSFGNQAPNCLFFSLDPVAIDCVMYDHLVAENPPPARSDDYLKLAAAAGLGTYERNAAYQYQLIDYVTSEVGAPVSTPTRTSTPAGTQTPTQTPTPTATATGTAMLGDDFNRADSTDLGPNWSKRVGDLKIAAQTLRNASTGRNVIASWNGGPYTNAAVSAQLQIISGTGAASVGLRWGSYTNGVPAAGYAASLRSNGQVVLWRVNTQTQLGAVYNIPSYAPGQVVTIALWANGTSLSVDVNGATRITATDSTFTSGQIGTWSHFSTAADQHRFDNFLIQNVSVPLSITTPVPPTRTPARI